MKKKNILVIILCLVMLLTACGNQTGASQHPGADAQSTVSAAVEETIAPVAETEPAAEMAPFLEEGKVLLDNEYITITLDSEVEESYYVGYKLILENKSDQYILVSTENTSIDGYMLYMSMQNSTVNPGKKAKAELIVYTTEADSMIKGLADLKNVEGVFRLSFNSDGGSSYTGNNDTYPFSIDGRQGGSGAAIQLNGQVLVDSDMVRITLTEPFDDDYAFGYKLVIENKTDEYILVSADNTSVDGFMVYLSMQNSSVAPGKTAVAELTAYSSNGDISSLDEFVNVEGVFQISTNSDGGGMYYGTNISYPFSFVDASAAEAVPPMENAPVENAPEAETEATQAADAYNVIVLGQTISTDDFDFTINNVELTYELKPRNTSSVYVSYPAEEGKVYIHIDAEYLNKSKRDICIRDLPVPHADYNDGYCYEGFVVVDDGDNSFDWVSSYVVAEPLTTCHYHGLIECPVIVDETGDPLFITIEINGVTYRYDIR